LLNLNHVVKGRQLQRRMYPTYTVWIINTV